MCELMLRFCHNLLNSIRFIWRLYLIRSPQSAMKKLMDLVKDAQKGASLQFVQPHYDCLFSLLLEVCPLVAINQICLLHSVIVKVRNLNIVKPFLLVLMPLKGMRR